MLCHQEAAGFLSPEGVPPLIFWPGCAQRSQRVPRGPGQEEQQTTDRATLLRQGSQTWKTEQKGKMTRKV